jgi:Flp pilus assembly protein TadG
MNRIRRSLVRNTKAATAMEFALVSSILMLMMAGGIEVAVFLWQIGTLQSVAAETARCAAIGSSLCTNPQTYAVTLANSWLGSNVITAANVTVSTPTRCGTGTLVGTWKVVAITRPTLSSLSFYPAIRQAVTVTACYPV